MNRVDLGTACFSEVSDELIYSTYDDDQPRTYFKDKAFEADYKLLQTQLPTREITFDSSTKDESVWMVTAWSDTQPGETYLFDRKTKKLTKQYRVRQKLPREALAEMRVVRYKSSDGLEIPAYLTLPKGVAPKNLPRSSCRTADLGPGYVGLQLLCPVRRQRGYVVLKPNFRASTGFGKKFLDAGTISGATRCRTTSSGASNISSPRHRRPEASRHLGRKLRRLRDAGGHHLHTGTVRGGGCRSWRRRT